MTFPAQPALNDVVASNKAMGIPLQGVRACSGIVEQPRRYGVSRQAVHLRLGKYHKKG